MIAHEINNPIEAVTNALSLLRDHPSLDEEARYYCRLAEEEMTRVAHITRQTLSFYRESQRQIAVPLSEVLDSVIELQARRLQLNGVALHKEYTTQGVVQGFPGELKQVFLNLIGNAVQAMPHGGRLRVRLYTGTDWCTGRQGIRVSVCDTGVGIRPEHARRIFEPFFSTKETKGTGLGLWISRTIIHKHEGIIRFRSLELGMRHFTCFSVFLPAVATGKTSDAAAALVA
jgi:signal transduction histidine kinase